MVTEIVALVLLAVLRLGLPVLGITAVSYLAYRWFGREETTRAAVTRQPVVTGPAPIARVLATMPHCWDEKGCTADQKALCPARARPEIPCWLAVQIKTGHLNKDCLGCHFYEHPTLVPEIRA